MDILDMKHFCAIVEAGNISNAANVLNISQPNLSKQMKSLEENLGVLLFERGNRRIRLTEAGQLFMLRAEQMLDLLDCTINEMTDFNSGNLGGTLSIGLVPASGSKVVSDTISKFCKLYPKVTFQIYEDDGFRIIDLLVNKVIDVGILRTPIDFEYYDCIPLPSEPLVVAMKKDEHQKEEKNNTIQLIELANQQLIVARRWKATFTEWCEKAGFAPKIICISSGGFLTTTLMVKSSIGIAIFPNSVKSIIKDPELIYKTIDPPMLSQLTVAWVRNRRLSPICIKFLDLIRDVVNLNKEETLSYFF
ncbi:MAG: LysR family transcriptional regulator [Clostridiaceae bacterium]|nr:LysR family transcriptional regulator [Clostridiaceae bacterium]